MTENIISIFKLFKNIHVFDPNISERSFDSPPSTDQPVRIQLPSTFVDIWIKI